MNRIAAVIVLVVGVATLMGGFTGVTPGLSFAGFWLTLAGLVSVGLSFIPRAPVATDEARPATAAQTITGVFTAPGQTFRQLGAHPRWLAAYLVAVLCLGIYGLLFVHRVTPLAIETARAQKIIDNGWISSDREEAFRNGQAAAARAPYYSLSPVVVTGVYSFLSIVGTAALFLFGVAMVGGRVNFWQALSVSAYAFLPPAVLRGLVGLLVLFIKAPDSIDPLHDQFGIINENLGAFLSPAQRPVLYTAATFLSLLWLYRVWLSATGLRNVSTKPISAGAAWAVAIGVWAIGLALWAVIAIANPSFIV
jgi:hypothetical protein